MKIRHIIISAMILSSVAITNTTAETAIPMPASSVQNLDEIAATVNNKAITQSQVDKAYAHLQKRYQQAGKTLPATSQVKTAVLNHLIDQQLQLQIANKFNVTVSKAEINQAVKNLAKQNNMTPAQFREKARRQGYSNKEFTQQISDQIKISKVQGEAVGRTINVTDSEVNQLLSNYNSRIKNSKEYHVIDIHIPLPSNPTSAQTQKAKFRALYIIQQLNKGKAYQKVGAKYSDLGWQSAAYLPTLFLAQLSHMHKGQVSKPIQAANGFHVLKLLNTKGSKRKPLARQQAKQIIFQQKFAKAVVSWIKKLRQSAYIKIVTPQ